jgi:hypothetical protein
VTDPVWHIASFEHLKFMLEYFRSALQRNEDRNIRAGLPQQLELTLPWGMDDGNGLVRLTVTGAPSAPGRPGGSLAVVVFADAVSFGEELRSPHYPGNHKPIAEERAVPRLTASVADFLLQQSGGTTLEEVGDGSVRFILERWRE